MIVFMNEIPLHLLSKYFGPSLKLHSNLHFENKLLKDFPSLYKQMLMNWKKYFMGPPITLSSVLSQFLWYNGYIKIHNKAVYLIFFQQRMLTISFGWFSQKLEHFKNRIRSSG